MVLVKLILLAASLVGIHTPLYLKHTFEADDLYLEIIQMGQKSKIDEKRKRRKIYRVQAIFAALGVILAFAGLFGVILFLGGLTSNPWIVRGPIISSILLLIPQVFLRWQVFSNVGK